LGIGICPVDSNILDMREILIDSVFHSFGQNEVLRGASFRLKTKQITGLLGRNGCGKSTMLKILTGGLAADNAYIGVDGVYQKDLYQQAGLINYLPQHSCHPSTLSLHRLVELYGLDAKGFFSEFGDFFTDSTMTLGNLSGGQSRLFETLLVLKAPAEFTLLDEPFSHIMPIHVETVKALIQTASQHRGILITDHQYRHVIELANPLYLVHSGRTTVVEELEDLVRRGYVREV
jgi:lipopolysaccharide export system ATP-binding protein